MQEIGANIIPDMRDPLTIKRMSMKNQKRQLIKEYSWNGIERKPCLKKEDHVCMFLYAAKNK